MKPACWEACFLYPCPTVEHSNNCLLLLCRLFLKPSGHYTKIGAKVAVVSFIKSSIPIAAGADFYAYIPIDIDTTDVIWAFPILTDAPGDNCTKVNISTCVWQDKSKRIYVNGCNLASGTANISLAGVLIAIR